MAAVTKEPPRCGRLGSGPRGSRVPAWVDVPKKGAVAAFLKALLLSKH